MASGPNIARRIRRQQRVRVHEARHFIEESDPLALQVAPRGMHLRAMLATTQQAARHTCSAAR